MENTKPRRTGGVLVFVVKREGYFTTKSEVQIMSAYDEITERYAQVLFLDLKSSNEETKSILQKRLLELIRFVKLARRLSPWVGLHPKLLAKDQDAWLFYLLWAYMSSTVNFQDVKALSPFFNQPIYVQRLGSVMGAVMRIALDPSELDGVSVL